ncbi:MAG: hypothetical protein FJ095_02560 [Deltaproteobacteria bacterium]|nr:hypothetical protein [Deltaproteobacteria bacterium]
MTRICIVLALVATACGGGAHTTAVTPESGNLAGELVDAQGNPAPAWVTNSGTADGRNLCSEGSVSGTRNISMAQTGAQGRARTALARSIQTKVAAMIRDYQSTTTGGEQFGTAGNDEQHIEDVSRQLTQVSLAGSQVVDTWISSTSTLHSLVCLDVERFKDSVNQMGQLDEKVRQGISSRAQNSWRSLDNRVGPR